MHEIAAVVLGIVQGLTEFLPVSSSAHLILVPWILGWKPEGLAFDVALHVGTAAALIVFFWRDWIAVTRASLAGLAAGKPFGTFESRLGWMLVLGSIPGGAAGLFLEDTIEEYLRSPLVTVVTLVAFGIVLWLAERRSVQSRRLEQFTWADAGWIGLAQALALVPGVSRSGVTMSAALLRDSSREAAARFSFLLSTPLILGAGGLELVRFLRRGGAGAAGSESTVAILLLGSAAAAITGFLCIRFFLRYLQTRSMTPFVFYRFALAALVLAIWLAGR